MHLELESHKLQYQKLFLLLQSVQNERDVAVFASSSQMRQLPLLLNCTVMNPCFYSDRLKIQECDKLYIKQILVEWRVTCFADALARAHESRLGSTLILLQQTQVTQTREVFPCLNHFVLPAMSSPSPSLALLYFFIRSRSHWYLRKWFLVML